MANLKNTNIDNNLELPSGTTGQRPASPQEGQIRYNTDLETAEFWNGANWRPLSDTHAEAEGGTVVDTDIGGVPYRIHYFTETGTDTLTVTNPGEVEYLVVAGGGGGGGESGGSGVGGTRGAGGGGAGGLLTGTTVVTPQAYTITVGAGGAGLTGLRNTDAGENSSAFGLTAIGGGQGGAWETSPSTGGSGGGGSVLFNGANGTSGQGNQGGNGVNPNNNAGGAGGGGGAGSIGLNGDTSYNGGDGGQGIVSNITGNNQFYAGGGGGGAGGIGGLGGGGSNLGEPGIVGNGTNAAVNTGGGGGGSAVITGSSTTGGTGGAGGSGIVIIRYPRNSSLDTEPDETRPSFQPYNYARDVRPIVSRTGLVLDLDAANPVSYPGSGSTVYNLGNGDITGNYAGDGVEFINEGQIYSWRSLSDDSNSGISFGSPAAFDFGDNGPYTIGAWVKFYDYRDYSSILCKSDGIGLGGPYTWLHVVYDQGLASYDGSNWFRRGNDDGIRLNQWYYVTFAYDGSTMRHYVNGDEVASFSYSYSENTSHEVYTVASWASNATSHSFNGWLGLLHCYARSLSITEIRFIFNSTRNRFGV